jgi:hypothetical protein
MADQKAVVYDVLQYLDFALLDQEFVESGDFTLRWGGADFFKDWRGPGFMEPGWDMRSALAVSYKHDNGPWKNEPGNPFPNNEIYFNRAYSWSFDLLGPPADKYDFWTVAMHEAIHMLACDNHAEHEDEVMFESIGIGVRKYPKLSDVDILLAAGYNVDPARLVPAVPEPATIVLVSLGGAVLAYRRRRRGGVGLRSSKLLN